MCLATFALFGTGGVIGTHGRVAGAYVIVYACLVRGSDSRAVRRVIRIQLHRLFRRRLLHCCVLFSRFLYAVLHLLMLLWYLVLQLLLLYEVLQLLRFVLSQALCLRVFVRSLGGFLRGCGLSFVFVDETLSWIIGVAVFMAFIWQTYHSSWLQVVPFVCNNTFYMSMLQSIDTAAFLTRPIAAQFGENRFCTMRRRSSGSAEEIGGKPGHSRYIAQLHTLLPRRDIGTTFV
mmetsp:Transcript_90522/g.146486  ORF Transcript_90522/g.146486 Transcript_90522/m.146486 type:complete len:232 (-) Transcript_90522:78-773(-)